MPCDAWRCLESRDTFLSPDGWRIISGRCESGVKRQTDLGLRNSPALFKQKIFGLFVRTLQDSQL